MSVRAASVWLHDRRAGELRQDDRGFLELHLDRAWLESSDRPVLGQWFEDRPGRHQRGERPGDLPSFLANLIPEGDLGLLLRDRLGVAPADDLGLLVAVGEDLPGAVVVREDTEPGVPEREIPDRPVPDRAADGLRFSLAGMQLKFSMVRSGDRFHVAGNDARGDWIVKIAYESFPGLCENEFVTMEWARRAGFEVPPCELRRLRELIDVPHEGDPEMPVFAVRRYDRDRARRIHQEDMMQVLGLPNWPSDRKYNDATYERLTALLTGVVGAAAFDEIVRRLVFVVASGNNDAHLKNWSIFYPDDFNAALTPLYDQIFAGQWPSLDRSLALKLAGAKPFGAIDLGRFRELARRTQRDPDSITELVARTLDEIAAAWAPLTHDVRVPDDYRRPLREHWESVPLLAPHAARIG